MSPLFLKISGGTLIMLSSLLLSRHCSKTLWKKVSFYDGLISGFTVLEELVCTNLIPIEQALSQVSRTSSEAGHVFSRASETDGDIHHKFSCALDENPEALKCIVPLSQGLLSPDGQISRSSFSAINKRLSEEREHIYTETKSLNRLYTAAGPLIGTAAIILLL